MLHETLQVSGVFAANVSVTILPFGGHSVACDGARLVFASANEYGVKLAGGFGTPRVAPFWRSRASSLVQREGPARAGTTILKGASRRLLRSVRRTAGSGKKSGAG